MGVLTTLGSAFITLPKITALSSNCGDTDWACSIVADYIDCDGSKYSVGVVAFVKIELKNGIHHQDVGYGICSNSCSKGYAIACARKVFALLVQQ